MIIKVVDTNVLVAANGRETHADESCQLKCMEMLEKIRNKGILVLDDLGLILAEYESYTNYSGQPGVGDLFFKHVYDNQYVEAKCQLVNITRNTEKPDDFKEFPKSSSLNAFDPSDRKFVAVSCACPQSPPIVNATDSDWDEFKDEFEKEGVMIEQLCPQHARKKVNQ